MSPPLNQVHHKPSSLTHAEAAALPLVGTTAVQAFWEHGLKEGQRVLVIGASGGVGHVAVQVAALQGAVVTAVCSGSNSEFVSKCGASTVLDYREGDIFEKIKEVRGRAGAKDGWSEATARTITLTNLLSQDAEKGDAYDIVLDCVNSADSRDSKASYRERILGMGGGVVKMDAGSDGHNYVVLGGRSTEWLTAGLLRFTRLNLFPSNFELFWIKMPGSNKGESWSAQTCRPRR